MGNNQKRLLSGQEKEKMIIKEYKILEEECDRVLDKINKNKLKLIKG